MRSSDWSSDVCSSDLFNFTVSPTDASGQAISIYVDIAGFGDGTNTYLDLVGEHTAYSVFPEALSTSQNVRFGFVLDYDALVAKVGLAANGHMHWVAIESGTVSFTDEYSSATARSAERRVGKEWISKVR